MLKHTIKVGDSNFHIPIELNFNTADKEDDLTEFYIIDEVEKGLPLQIDYEVSKFRSNVEEIQIRLFKVDGTPYVYADFGFTDDDLKFFYNRLQKSFISINFFDNPKKLQQQRFFQTDLFVQRVTLFDNGVLKTANDCEIIFNIKNPKNFTNETEGFFIYLNNSEFTAPFSLYANFRFNNAYDGNSYTIIPHSNVTLSNFTEDKEYVKINFINKSYTYDTTNNTLTNNTNILNIDLYAFA